jgi:hypothetical protein
MKPFALFLLLLFSTFANAGENVSDGRSPMGPLVMDGSGTSMELRRSAGAGVATATMAVEPCSSTRLK